MQKYPSWADFSAKNGRGDDIAIYAKRAGTQDGMPAEEGLPASIDGAEVLGALTYGVLVMGESGDWEAIGQGTGTASLERFDLGSISSIKKISIVFKYFDNASLGARPYRIHAQEYSMGIDAVAVLHLSLSGSSLDQQIGFLAFPILVVHSNKNKEPLAVDGLNPL